MDDVSSPCPSQFGPGEKTAHNSEAPSSAIRRSNRLMAANAAHAQYLPPSWMTLYELTKLSDERLYAKLEAGEIWPEMLRKDVAHH